MPRRKVKAKKVVKKTQKNNRKNEVLEDSDDDLDEENSDLFADSDSHDPDSDSDDEDDFDSDDGESDDSESDDREAPAAQTYDHRETLAAQTHEQQDLDIFMDFGEPEAQKGRFLYYLIKRNGEILGRRDHPYDLTKLQKEFGGGVYTIQARDGITNAILKWGSYRIAGAMLSVDSKTDEKPVESVQSNSLGVMDALSLMEKFRTQSKAEQQEASREQANNQNMLMTMMVQMMTQSQAQMQESMKANTQTTMQLIMQMNQSTNEMMKMVQTQIKDIVESLNKKGSQQDPFQLVKLMSEWSEKGKEDAMRLQDLIEAKVEDKASILAELEAIKAGKQETKSSFDKLLETLAPLLAGVVQGGVQANAMPPAVQALPQTHAQVIPRTSVQVMPQAKAQTPVQVLPQTSAQVMPQTSQVKAVPLAKGQTVPQARAQTSQVKAAPLAKAQTVPQAVPLAKALTTNEEKLNLESKKKLEKEGDMNKQELVELLSPLIGDSLIKRKDPSTAANESMQMLGSKGFTKVDVLSHFKSAEELIDLAKSKGVPSLANPWLRSYFEAIVSL